MKDFLKGKIMIRTNTIGWIALALVIIGALNWGLVGLFGFDLVATLFGEMSILSRILYILIGISAFTLLIEVAATFQGHHHHPHTA